VRLQEKGKGGQGDIKGFEATVGVSQGQHSPARYLCAIILLSSPKENAMADILIRNLNPRTVARLKQSGKKHGRSLQAHLKFPP
jgi:hypothetical protein